MTQATKAERQRYWDAAPEHLAWCREHGIEGVGGRWDLEAPITGLLLAAMPQSTSATATLNTLCGRSWSQVKVDSAWWPSGHVDVLVNFHANGEKYLLALENKHLETKSNQPGYEGLREKGQEHEIRWQTETTLCKIDRVRADGGNELLGGPFDPAATVMPIFLDAAGRTMDEAFPLYEWMVPPHRHEEWQAISYAELAAGLRAHYEHTKDPALVPLLGQLFAPAARHV